MLSISFPTAALKLSPPGWSSTQASHSSRATARPRERLRRSCPPGRSADVPGCRPLASIMQPGRRAPCRGGLPPCGCHCCRQRRRRGHQQGKQSPPVPNVADTRLSALRQVRHEGRAESYAMVRRLHEEGMPPRLIALGVGMSQRNVERWLRTGGEPEHRRLPVAGLLNRSAFTWNTAGRRAAAMRPTFGGRSKTRSSPRASTSSDAGPSRIAGGTHTTTVVG